MAGLFLRCLAHVCPPFFFHSADLIATAGTLGGTSPVVSVVTLTDGGLPLELVTSDGNLQASSSMDKPGAGYYYARVSAFNGVGWSAPRVAPVAAVLAPQPPAPPVKPTVARVSPTKLAVSWSAPARDGGAAVTKYSVQWATDTAFDGDAGLNLVDASQARESVPLVDRIGIRRNGTSTSKVSWVVGQYSRTNEKQTNKVSHVSRPPPPLPLLSMCASGERGWPVRVHGGGP